MERLKRIEPTLSGSDYVRLGDLPLAKVYAHKRLTPSRSIILLTATRSVARGRLLCYEKPVNWHEVIDARSLEMHRVVARELRADPAKLERVVAWIQRFLTEPDYSVQSKDALTEWLDLIRTRGLPGVLAALEDPSDEGQRMRQSSPFAVIMPQDERQRILARYEALAARTHTAGV